MESGKTQILYLVAIPAGVAIWSLCVGPKQFGHALPYLVLLGITFAVLWAELYAASKWVHSGKQSMALAVIASFTLALLLYMIFPTF